MNPNFERLRETLEVSTLCPVYLRKKTKDSNAVLDVFKRTWNSGSHDSSTVSTARHYHLPLKCRKTLRTLERFRRLPDAVTQPLVISVSSLSSRETVCVHPCCRGQAPQRMTPSLNTLTKWTASWLHFDGTKFVRIRPQQRQCLVSSIRHAVRGYRLEHPQRLGKNRSRGETTNMQERAEM